MVNKDHATTLERVFREMGHDAKLVQTGNGTWVVTIKRSDGRIVCVNDDAVGLYENEEHFFEGIEQEILLL